MASSEAAGAKPASSAAKSASVASARPVHPAYVPVFPSAGGGAELTAWAYLTHPRPPASSSISGAGSGSGSGDAPTGASGTGGGGVLPNLVTANANVVRVYALDPLSHRLVLASSYDDLSGNVVSLDVLPSSAGSGSPCAGRRRSCSRGGGGEDRYDGLLLGFGGHPRLSVVYPSLGSGRWSGVLAASSIIDLTPALTEACAGSTSPLEQDLIAAVHDGSGEGAGGSAGLSGAGDVTAAVVLGGGAAVACFELVRSPRPPDAAEEEAASGSGWWRTASAPYSLPLHRLSKSIKPEPSASATASQPAFDPRGKGGRHHHSRHASHAASNAAGFAVGHGFGDVLSCAFLRGYTEPVLAVLHSNPERHGGRAWSGRMGVRSTTGSAGGGSGGSGDGADEGEGNAEAHASGGARNPLTLTAISLSVPHRRSVPLWSLRDLMPADAVEVVAHPTDGVIVRGVNELLYVDGTGRMRGGLAVNGFARGTSAPGTVVPPGVADPAKHTISASVAMDGAGAMGRHDPFAGYINPNPSPLPRLSLHLDGARLSFLSDDVAAISLSDGTLYNLELHRNGGRRGGGVTLSLAPVGHRLGGVGLVSCLSSLPLAALKPGAAGAGGGVVGKFLEGQDDTEKLGGSDKADAAPTRVGLLFAGSRLGDSSLLMYGLREKVPLRDESKGNARAKKETVLPTKEDAKDDDKDGGSRKRKRDDDSDVKKEDGTEEKAEPSSAAAAVSDAEDDGLTAYERQLRQEEEELYAEDDDEEGIDGPDIVPLSDEDEPAPALAAVPARKPLPSRPALTHISVHSPRPPRCVDSLPFAGPLGPSCPGPDGTSVHPCGYGSSGGLAVLGAPGLKRDEVMAEGDCAGVVGAWSAKGMGVCVLGRGEGKGAMVLKVEGVNATAPARLSRVKEEEGVSPSSTGGKAGLAEVDVPDWAKSSVTPSSSLPSLDNAADVLGRMTVLHCREWPSPDGRPYLVLLVKCAPSSYGLVVLAEDREEDGGTLRVVHSHDFAAEGGDGEALVGATPMESSVPPSSRGVDDGIGDEAGSGEDSLLLSVLFSSGRATVLALRRLTMGGDVDWSVSEAPIAGGTVEGPGEKMETDEDEDEALRRFYKSDKIVAMDAIVLPEGAFTAAEAEAEAAEGEGDGMPKAKEEEAAPATEAAAAFDPYGFDADDLELYGPDFAEEAAAAASSVAAAVSPAAPAAPTAGTAGDGGTDMTLPPSRFNALGAPSLTAPLGGGGGNSGGGGGPKKKGRVYLAAVRQSSLLQIYDAELLLEGRDEEEATVWRGYGCGLGASSLRPSSSSRGTTRTPRMHKVRAAEIRMFFTGPAPPASADEDDTTEASPYLRSLCLLVETDLGDAQLYTATERRADDGPRRGGSASAGSGSSNGSRVEFARVPLRLSSRPGREEARHRTKLRRRGMLPRSALDSSLASASTKYRYHRLCRFSSISGQSGLFAALARPLWIVSERGAPTVVGHRCRHAAPTGGTEVPVAGFCADLPRSAGESGFLTLHERVGKVGSQRISLFNGLSSVFTPLGLLPGGQLTLQKLPLGATVRSVQALPDPSVSTPSHPLYALLISRETESDQSALNDDGLSPEERRRRKEEKEAAKTQRQVEADLGGFDVEQEWVEEIEREDCLGIEVGLGGAPPLPGRVYELWLVDAGAGWTVVDMFQLEKYEHGMTMRVMPLTELAEETQGPSGSAAKIEEKTTEDTSFIVVGTAVVDGDGEDISSKGRILLLQARRSDEDDGRGELSLVYEKDISHGPVASVSRLTSEGRSRLVVGGGSDVNVEQWGNGKLTQVGFFRATMQIQEVTLFKNFFLLSDAYDSLHFLVWRESDKSLTLLAKDYEPVNVYAAGVVGRGGTMSFVCHDDRQNAQFFQYAPSDAAARGGNKLVCRADVHLGTQTTAFSSHWCKSTLLVHSATPHSTLAALKQRDPLFGRGDDDNRFAVHFGTTDGGLGAIVPLSDQSYWRLTALQSVMGNALESHCALSARSWRLYRRTARRGGCRGNDRRKGTIDGELVCGYVDLPLAEQEDLAGAIGSTVELIVDNVLELVCSSMVV